MTRNESTAKMVWPYEGRHLSTFLTLPLSVYQLLVHDLSQATVLYRRRARASKQRFEKCESEPLVLPVPRDL